MSEAPVLYETQDYVATITLNRPENRNSMTPDVLGGFREAIGRVAETVRTEPGRRLVEFLRGESRRGYMGFKRRGHDSGDAEQIQ